MEKMEKEINISEIIRKRRYNLAVRRDYQRLLIRATICLFIGWILFTQVFLLMRNAGNGMFPALKDGDLILAYRLVDSYEKDDVVVYKVNGVRTVGRIVATANDTVAIDESGNLHVNGTIQTGEILYPTYAKEGIPYPYQVTENNYFILGDYRTQAKDSRDCGAVAIDDIEGKVLTLLRRRGI